MHTLQQDKRSTVKLYAEEHCVKEHQPGSSMGNKNIFILPFCRNKNIIIDKKKNINYFVFTVVPEREEDNVQKSLRLCSFDCELL